MRVRRIHTISLAIIIAILGGLLLSATSVFADEHEEEDSGRRGMYGTVVSVSEEDGTAVIETRSGSVVTIDLNSTGLYVEEGDNVALLVGTGEEGQPVPVIRGLVRPDHPQILHVSGAVVSKTATSMTIVDATGREHIVEIPEGVEISVSAGDHAVVVTSNENGDPPKAEAAINASAIADQMKEHAATLREQAQAGELPLSTAEERIQRLESRLEFISSHLQSVYSELEALGKVPSAALEAVHNAMTKIQENFGPPEQPPAGGPPLRPEGTPGRPAE